MKRNTKITVTPKNLLSFIEKTKAKIASTRPPRKRVYIVTITD